VVEVRVVVVAKLGTTWYVVEVLALVIEVAITTTVLPEAVMVVLPIAIPVLCQFRVFATRTAQHAYIL